MQRDEAILKICGLKLRKLSFEGRKNIITDFWNIDNDDKEFSVLSSSLQKEILENDEPINNTNSSKYDPLIMEALKNGYIGVTNNYIGKVLSNELGKEIFVYGNREDLLPCPCCLYKTLETRGDYDICPVCFWEDSGIDNLNRYSGPNHMTLKEGMENFKKFGTVEERFKKLVYGKKEMYSK